MSTLETKTEAGVVVWLFLDACGTDLKVRSIAVCVCGAEQKW